MQKLFLSAVLGGLLLGTAPGYCDTYIRGTITRITPTGIYVESHRGVTFIPRSNASTFMVNDERVQVPSQLPEGTEVRISYGDREVPRFIPTSYWRDHANWTWERQVSQYNMDQADWDLNRREGSNR